MLIGKKDAWALTAIGLGFMGATPWLAGNPLALGLLALPGLGGAWIAHKRAEKHFSRIDTKAREKFTLKSDDLFPECMQDGTGLRFGYTRDKSLPLDIENQFLQRHTAIIGQSGVGKTTLGEYLLWQQIVRGGGFCFVDAKLDADTRDKLNFMMELAGRADEYYVLNVDEPHNSHTYNPLLQGDPDEIASRLLNLLPSSENSPGADYFRQQSNYALTVLVGALKAAKRRYHFADLAILLQSDRALESLLRLPISPEAKMPLEVFLNQFRKKDKNGSSIDVNKIKEVLGGMSGRIATFSQNKFGKVFNTYTPEIDLTDIVMNNKCIYVMLPTMGKDTAALNLGKMILSDLRTAVYKVQGLKKSLRPNPPFLVFADEMGSYVMPGIARVFEQARSANICMLPAFQSFANLSVVSPDFADIIIGNTWNKVFFKFASKDSPETAAEIIGKTVKYSVSYSLSESESDSNQNLRATPQGNASAGSGLGQSFREKEDYRVTPDQLKCMGMGECVVVSGPKMFHINTPMLEFEAAIPEFKVSRKNIRMPDDEIGLDLVERYKDFIDAGGGPTADQSFVKQQESEETA